MKELEDPPRVIVDGVDITAQVALLKKLKSDPAVREAAVPISATFMKRMQSSVPDEEVASQSEGEPEWIVRI